MAPEIERITNTFLSNPHRVEVARQATASETIDQGVLLFKPSRRDRSASEKRRALRDLIDAEGEKLTNAIIFCNRKTDVDAVAKSLKKYNYDCAPIHGDLDQSVRTRTLDGFRAGEIRLLVASDVAARGLDVPSVSHVINFDVPGHAEDYVHRIGRTGRAGRSGKAITICQPSDEKNLDDVEALIGKAIPRLESASDTDAAATPGTEAKAAPAPAPTATEDTPKPKRSRSRSRKPRDEDQETPQAAPVAETPAAETPAAEADAKPEPKAEPTAVAQTKTDDEDRPRRSRGGKGRGRSGGGGGRDDRVVGMGDHMPTFIEKSFEERLDS